MSVRFFIVKFDGATKLIIPEKQSFTLPEVAGILRFCFYSTIATPGNTLFSIKILLHKLRFHFNRGNGYMLTNVFVLNILLVNNHLQGRKLLNLKISYFVKILDTPLTKFSFFPRHDMMLKCWSEDRLERPTFSDLRQELDDVISAGDSYCTLDVDEESNVYTVPSFNTAPEEIESENSEAPKQDINNALEEIENESSEAPKQDINGAPEEIRNENSEASKQDINGIPKEIENESSEASKQDIISAPEEIENESSEASKEDINNALE